MTEPLRAPIIYPNWVWLLGVALIVIAAAWIGGMTVAYRRSRRVAGRDVHSLGQLRQARYRRHLHQIGTEFNAGELTAREAHLSISALVRAVSSERLHRNVEHFTVAQARSEYPQWPQFYEALLWCERPSFGDHEAYDTGVEDAQTAAAVRNGMQLAESVIA